LTSPPATVLCNATTATWPSRGPSLVARSPIPCVLLSFVVSPQGSWAGRSAQPPPGPLVTRSPSPGCASRSQRALPSSRVSPMDTCPALRPRWCPGHSPKRTQDCCLPATEHRRLTTTLSISGLHHAAYVLATPSFVRPLTGRHVGSLLTRWLNLSQVGLASCAHPLGSNNQFHGVTPNSKVSGLTWRDQWLMRSWPRAVLRFTLLPVLAVGPAQGGRRSRRGHAVHASMSLLASMGSASAILCSSHGFGRLRGWNPFGQNIRTCLDPSNDARG